MDRTLSPGDIENSLQPILRLKKNHKNRSGCFGGNEHEIFIYQIIKQSAEKDMSLRVDGPMFSVTMPKKCYQLKNKVGFFFVV